MTRLRDETINGEQSTGVDVRLLVALDNMPGALVYTDKDLNIVVCNNRFREMYPVPEELLQPGRPIPNFCAIWPSTAITAKAIADAQVAPARGKPAQPDGRASRTTRPTVAGTACCAGGWRPAAP